MDEDDELLDLQAIARHEEARLQRERFGGALITEDIWLRAPTVEDARFVSKIENDPDLKKLTGGVSGTQIETYYKRLAQPSLSMLIIETVNGREPIGRCGLLTSMLDVTEAEIHVLLARQYWGDGIGSKVASMLRDVARERYPGVPVTAKIHPENGAALAIARKAGFVQVCVIPSGKWEGFLRFRIDKCEVETLADT